MLKNCRDLKVWQASYQLCLEIYKVTKIFPKNEGFGFTSQVKRAALSIPSNIS
ncbi:MAG: four helix bundle protein [Deltaproteobacteria bacterium]|nr:four helix bundle protein [Deltaproteobacteria bacterium]